VAELTGLCDLTRWPAGMRVIVRRERPHPGDTHRQPSYPHSQQRPNLRNYVTATPGELRDRGHALRRAELDTKVAEFHAASDGVYGAPRIVADLRADGERVSRKTMAASLCRQGVASICPRRFALTTTVVDRDAAVPKDLVRHPVRHRGAQPGLDVEYHLSGQWPRAGCICARCAMTAHGGWSAGRSINTCTPI
jgi:HTH-like domain